MNANVLKLIGIIGMVLDHIGWVLFPDIALFHFIGCITFPIFCYFITEGFLKTHNRRNYLLRLLGIALISQIPFVMTFRLAFGEGFSGFNTLFNLVIGLVTIWLYDKAHFKGKFIIVILGALCGVLFMTDGDIYGVLMIFFFYKYHNEFKKMAISVSILTVIYHSMYQIYAIVGTWAMGIMTASEIIEVITGPNYYAPVLFDFAQNMCSLLALILIRFYNGEKGKNLKILFYAFYPLHLIIIYIIKVGVM